MLNSTSNSMPLPIKGSSCIKCSPCVGTHKLWLNCPLIFFQWAQLNIVISVESPTKGHLLITDFPKNLKATGAREVSQFLPLLFYLWPLLNKTRTRGKESVSFPSLLRFHYSSSPLEISIIYTPAALKLQQLRKWGGKAGFPREGLRRFLYTASVLQEMRISICRSWGKHFITSLNGLLDFLTEGEKKVGGKKTAPRSPK